MADINRFGVDAISSFNMLHARLSSNWVSEGYDSIEEENEYMTKGIALLSNYYHNPQDKGTSILIEEMIYLEKERYILCGRLDKIYKRPDGFIEVVDYKTGLSIEPLDLIQLPLYLMLAEARLNFVPSYISLYFLAINLKLEVVVEPWLVKWSKTFMEELCNVIISEEIFEANPSGSCYGSCEYYHICRLSSIGY